MAMRLQFEDLTIGQLKKLTEEYNKLARENYLLRVKYPNKRPVIDDDPLKDMLEVID